MTRSRKRRTPVLVTLAALVIAIVAGLAQWGGASGSGASGSGSSPSGPEAGARPAAAGSAREALDTLEIRTADRVDGYERDLFAWRTDTDRNGCDTRNDVLRRDLASVVVRDGTRGCVVQTGVLEDPYSDARVAFDRTDAEAVQIDHVVALSDAWSAGAWRWDEEYRTAFANDPLELVAASAAENNAKSDARADEWLPDDPAEACALVARQVSVKVHTELSVTRAEHDAMARVLDGCPDQPLLTPDDVPWPAPVR